MAGSVEKIRSYKDLLVWQQAMQLAADTYRLTARWPKEELYGLTSQARRAAASVPANIAEGFGRGNRGSYVQFLRIAQGSLKELETHVLLAVRVEIAPEAEIEPLLAQTESVGKLLRLLIWKLVPDQP
ncbi:MULTISPECIES: four helix bundle protein [unclassified Aminobacter]|uniref:four helix bundle protein n=1 Tax=unclassified Aminobacter TaxID=2644704 RepID=UPI0004B73F92|nr:MULTISPECIES: four helix bundle protein [unclassified Aminobacter]TWG61713.1 four helix bundle protein [Aminobacter sp. J44]TWH34087.1 four helix bundle protein [Aminobacter sp. J15]